MLYRVACARPWASNSNRTASSPISAMRLYLPHMPVLRALPGRSPRRAPRTPSSHPSGRLSSAPGCPGGRAGVKGHRRRGGSSTREVAPELGHVPAAEDAGVVAEPVAAAADHDGPSMYTSGWRRMQQPQFAWQLPYPCGYGGRSVPVPSSLERHRPAASTVRVTPPVFPIAVSVALCSSVTPAPALRSGLPQVLSPPPHASDFSRVLNCFKLTSAPPSNNDVVVGLRGNGGTIWTTREGC